MGRGQEDILTRSQSAGCRDRMPQRGPRNCDLTEYLPGWHVAWGESKENDTEVQWEQVCLKWASTWIQTCPLDIPLICRARLSPDNKLQYERLSSQGDISHQWWWKIEAQSLCRYQSKFTFPYQEPSDGISALFFTYFTSWLENIVNILV